MKVVSEFLQAGFPRLVYVTRTSVNRAMCNFLLHLFLFYTWYSTLRLKSSFLIEVNRVYAVVALLLVIMIISISKRCY